MSSPMVWAQRRRMALSASARKAPCWAMDRLEMRSADERDTVRVAACGLGGVPH